MSYSGRHTGAIILLVKDQKILLLRRANTGWADGMLTMPSGHLEKGESGTQGAVREIQEEVGLDIESLRLNFFTSGVYHTNDDYVNIGFSVELSAEENPLNNEPDKCSELIWCDPRNLPSDVAEPFRSMIIRGYLGGEPYLEVGYDD